jgi:hypothetical protein
LTPRRRRTIAEPKAWRKDAESDVYSKVGRRKSTEPTIAMSSTVVTIIEKSAFPPFPACDLIDSFRWHPDGNFDPAVADPTTTVRGNENVERRVSLKRRRVYEYGVGASNA